MSIKRKAQSGSRRPGVTAIVPVEPGGDPSLCIKALRACKAVSGGLEVLVTRGLSPSRQRNLAVNQARGDYLLFIDSDALADENLVETLLGAFNEKGVAVAGGPNVAPLDQTEIQRAISAVLSSRFGSAASRSRYISTGQDRDTTEKELILCNLMVRTDVFTKAGGFREDLYPNEENELLNRLSDEGWRFKYLPGALVRRPRRETVAAFGKQAFRYGRGRMRQVKANAHWGDIVQLAPLVYVLGWILFAVLKATTDVSGNLGLALAASYAVPLLLSSTMLWLEHGLVPGMMGVILFPLRHFGYAFGLAAGLLGGQEARDDAEVKIERVN